MAEAGTAIAQIADTAQTMGARGSQSLQRLATDQQERDKLLLGIAALALTTALSVGWLRRT